MRDPLRQLLFFLLIAGLLLTGCQGEAFDQEPPFKTLAPLTLEQGEAVLPLAGGLFPAVTPTPGVYIRHPSDDYPAPQPTNTKQVTDYPEPEPTDTKEPTPYEGPEVTNTPQKSRTPTPTGSITPGTVTASYTPKATRTTRPDATKTATPTLARAFEYTPGPDVTLTEFVGEPVGTPVPPRSVISIWHGLVGDQDEALHRIIDSFQNAYPDVSFSIAYVPKDELRSRYEAASYYGKGPSLLLAPTSWGWWYAKGDLVSDVSAYASAEFLQTINPVAMQTLYFGDKLIGLPFAEQGYVLYRNTAILSQPAKTLDELIANAQRATGMGRVGGYLEREAIVSSAILTRLGGSLMDEQGRPTFNNDLTLDWLGLIGRYSEAGVAGMHTNRDIDLFKEGMIGVIIEGTWRLGELTAAIGAENLAIDPWPMAGEGSLSGYVQSEAVFLNTNTSQDDLLASLRFMGYLFNRDVQTLFGESGLIPTVLDATPRSVHVQQAMTALQGGSPWPLMDETVLQVYWNALDEAILNVFERGQSAESALQSSFDVVNVRLDELNTR